MILCDSLLRLPACTCHIRSRCSTGCASFRSPTSRSGPCSRTAARSAGRCTTGMRCTASGAASMPTSSSRHCSWAPTAMRSWKTPSDCASSELDFFLCRPRDPTLRYEPRTGGSCAGLFEYNLSYS